MKILEEQKQLERAIIALVKQKFAFPLEFSERARWGIIYEELNKEANESRIPAERI